MKSKNSPKLSKKTLFVFRSPANRKGITTDPTISTVTIITTTYGNQGGR
jgi:hypothetical protein